MGWAPQIRTKRERESGREIPAEDVLHYSGLLLQQRDYYNRTGERVVEEGLEGGEGSILIEK